MNSFFNNKRVKAVFISTVFASSILRVESVAAQGIEPESTETEEVLEYNENLKEKIENFLLNIEIPANIEEKLEVALNNHLDGQFKEASKHYEELLNNIELNEKLQEALIKYFNMASNEVALTGENILAVIMEEEEYFLDNNVEHGASEDKLSEFNTGDKENEKQVDEQSTIIEEEYIESESSEEDEEAPGDEEESEPSEEDEEAPDDGEESEPSEEDEEIPNEDEASEILSTVAITTSASNNADEMYEAVINAQNASSSWTKALEFKKSYPEDSRLEEAINAAAQRIASMGKIRHKNNDFSNAIYYYQRVLNEDLVNDTLKTEFTPFYSQALNNVALMTDNEMYVAVIDAPNASSAWRSAQAFKEYYSNSNQIEGAFESAGQRIFNMGQTAHKSANFSTAIYYYNLLLNEPMISSSTKDRVSNFKDQAENNSNVITETALFNQTINAPNASSAWNSAQEFKKLYPQADRLSEAFQSAGQRIYNMGISRHKSGDYSSALIYYDMLINEPLTSEAVRSEVEVYRSQALQDQKLTTAEDMFKQVVNAPNASQAWRLAQEFKSLYQNSNHSADAIKSAGQRIYKMGISSHKANNYSLARTYYEMLINERLIDESIRAEVGVYNSQASNNNKLETAEDILISVNSAPNASSAWTSALNFKENFPGNSKLPAAFESAGRRIYNMGVSNHRSSEFSSAITYYDLLLNEPLISSSVKNDVEFLKRQAQNKSTVIDADKTLNKSLNANTASEAWYAAYEGLETFPNDTRFINAIRKAADRIFSVGVSNHNNGNFTQANIYYKMLIGNEYIDTNIKNKSEYYSYLANNNLYLTNIVVKNTQYNYSLSEAVSTQMNIKNAKPQASHNGGWRNATRAEVTQYINPQNQLPESNTAIEDALSKIEITTGALNVRTGPSTSSSLIDTVYQGEIYSIVDEQNGWYQIIVNGSRGWVSGNTSYVARDNSALQFLVLSGSSGISVSDLDEELNNAGILKGHGSAFREASRTANINELYLISHAILETGYGTSNLATGILVTEVNGKSVEPKVVYNMFGIGAVDSAPDRLGSERAYQEGWFTPEEAIIGGAQWISSSYINNPTYKQDTLYKMRWNPERPGTHQYATDVAWANKQTNSLNSIVHLSKKYDLLLTFDVPLYK